MSIGEVRIFKAFSFGIENWSGTNSRGRLPSLDVLGKTRSGCCEQVERKVKFSPFSKMLQRDYAGDLSTRKNPPSPRRTQENNKSRLGSVEGETRRENARRGKFLWRRMHSRGISGRKQNRTWSEETRNAHDVTRGSQKRTVSRCSRNATWIYDKIPATLLNFPGRRDIHPARFWIPPDRRDFPAP